MTRREFLKKAGKGAAGILGAHLLGPLAQEALGEIAPAKEQKRVVEEIQQARDILRTNDPSKFIHNRFVVSALYYSDRFLAEGLRSLGAEEILTNRVLMGIRDFVTPELRKKYTDYLSGLFSNATDAGEYSSQVLPLEKIDFGRGENHSDAIDLFTPEGAPVFSISDGVVVLAENGWKQDDQLSTASFKDGNAVIIFSPQDKEFYRYCHLRETRLQAGMIVRAHDEIGIVGHTGKNASQPGHGNHLHLEINAFDENTSRITSVSAKELRRRLSRIQNIAQMELSEIE